MSEILRLSWSIAHSGWRSTWNRSYRFSRMKTALIFLVIQALFFLMIARRTPAMASGRAAAEGLGGLFVLMAIQMGWFGLMYGFTRGQMQLYQGILVPLFQISPARPLAFLIGRVIEAIPTRAWSCLLWAWAYSGVVPGAARWGAALLMAAFGLLVGMVAHLSGLLLLTFWSRFSPKTMRNGTVFFGSVTLAIATWAVIYLSEGGTVSNLAIAMRQYRATVGLGVVLIGGIPGLVLLGTLLLKPQSVEDLYRHGLYKVLELGEADVTRPGRSRWLPIADGTLRAVLSREWLELARSRVAKMQMMIWVAGTVGVYAAGHAMAGQSLERVIQFVGALSLLTWFMSFGHWIVRVFERERKTILLYRLAAVPTRKLMTAKFMSIFVPSAFLVAVSSLVGGLAARLSLGHLGAVIGWSMAGLLAGSIGGFGVSAATANEDPEDQEVDAAPRRGGETPQPTGNAWWSIARTGALVITAALPVWTGAGQPGVPFTLPAPALLGVNVLLPVGLLLVGSWLMIRSWEVEG